MCGIAGIFNYSALSNEFPKDSVIDMLDVIHHRGPDESGIYSNNQVCMGSVRLSIIDLTSGQQPLCDSSENYWIVYNGEIFNYIELREELKSLGYKFKTTSDTEVLVQLYAHYGKNCLNKLNGQFAFAIWDKRKKELFLARDRVGIRPLFYSVFNGLFVFGSEIKAIFQCPGTDPSINYNSLKQIFTFWSTITPYTIFNNVFEVPPGHYAIVKQGKGIEVNRFWTLDYSSITPFKSIDDAKEELSFLITDAVRLRLRADVQVAAYLSGGLDSTYTTALIKSVDHSVLNTYSIGFQDAEYDETKYQKEASEYLQTKHSARICSSTDIAGIFPSVMWHGEMPILRTSPAPMYLLSQKVRQDNIKVVITGEGADEMLAGYDIFKEDKIRRFWANEPASTCRPALLQQLYPYIAQLHNARPGMLKFFYGYKLQETANPFYSHLLRWNNTSHIQQFFNKSIIETVKDYDPLSELDAMLSANYSKWSGLAKAQYLESNIFMSSYLLSSQGDRMAMANSVEGRYPFLDYRVIEFAAKLPDRFKLNGLNEKFILKKAAGNHIPKSINERPKQAYRAPISSTFLGKNVPEYVNEILNEKTINDFGIFDAEQVANLRKKIIEPNQQTEMNNMALTGIISTQLIVKQFIKSPSPRGAKRVNPRIIIEKN